VNADTSTVTVSVTEESRGFASSRCTVFALTSRPCWLIAPNDAAVILIA
jgi:hypothetical protein